MNQAQSLSWKELLDKQEDLLPPLKGFMQKGALGPMLNHPLVQRAVIHPAEYALTNEAFRQKLAAVREADASKNWGRYIFLHERPYRMTAFLSVAPRMNDRHYWKLLGNVWTDSDNIWQHRNDWTKAFTNKERSLSLRPLLMDREERKALAALPNRLVVYRGGSSRSRNSARLGLSWTLSRAKAAWFATRLLRTDEQPMLYRRVVDKSAVIAHFTGRNEDEVVVMPSTKTPPQALRL